MTQDQLGVWSEQGANGATATGSFITATPSPLLTNSRYVQGINGIVVTDNGPGNSLDVGINQCIVPTNFQPTGGDDGPSLSALIVTKKYIRLCRGLTYLINTPVVLLSDLTLDLNGANIIANIPLDEFANSIFYGRPLVAGPVAHPTAVNIQGTYTFLCDTAFAVGDRIRLTEQVGMFAQTYTVRSCVGGAPPYTITLDRPCNCALTVGATVIKYASYPERIYIIGSGATISGIADRAFEIWGALDCKVSNVIIDGSQLGPLGANIGASFDVGCYRCGFEDIVIDGGGVLFDGLSVEGGEECYIERCRAIRCTLAGIHIYDNWRSTFRDNIATGNGTGIVLSSDGPGYGCYECLIDGGDFSGNTSKGVLIATAARCIVRNANAHFTSSAVGDNFAIDATSVDAIIDGCNASNAGRSSILIANGAINTKISKCRLWGVSAGLSAIYVQSDVQIEHTKIYELRVNGWGVRLDNATANVHVYGGTIESKSASSIGINILAACNARLNGIVFTVANNGLAVMGGLNINAVVWVQSCTFTGTGYGYYGQLKNTLRDLGGNVWATTQPLVLINVNIGEIILNGAVAVDWPFIDLRADPNDQVTLTRKTAGGVAGVAPTFTKTIGAGGKVSVTGTAGDTSVYTIEIR